MARNWHNMALCAVFLLIAGIVAGTAWSEAAKVEACAVLDRVVLYSDAVLTTSVATADIPAGYTEVTISGLCRSSSLHTVIRGKGPFTLVSTEFKNIFEKRPPSPELASYTKRKEELEAKFQDVKTTQSLLAREHSYYMALSLGASRIGDRGEVPSDLTVAQVKELLSVFETNLTDVATRQLAAKRAYEELEGELRKVNDLINQSGGGISSFSCVAIVTVKAEMPTKATFELMSLGGNSGWASCYDARLDISGKVSLAYYADVRQHTGEEWKDVKLRLSTSGILAAVLPPELERLVVLGFKTPPSQPAGTTASRPEAPSPATTAPAMTFPRSTRPTPQPGRVAEATAVNAGGGMAVEFDLPSRATVPGNGTVRRLLVQQIELQGNIEYDTAPRVSPTVYARVETTNTSAFPFTAGTLRAFSGGEFLGTTSFGPVATGEKFKLFFGEDSRVRAKYRHISSDRQDRWRSMGLEFDWILELSNDREQSVTVNLSDALPKSGNDEVKVHSVKYDPRPLNDPENDDLGMARWKLVIPPGQKVEVRISFTVSYPRNVELNWTGPWQGGAK